MLPSGVWLQQPTKEKKRQNPWFFDLSGVLA